MRFVEENTRPAARMSTICCEASSAKSRRARARNQGPRDKLRLIGKGINRFSGFPTSGWRISRLGAGARSYPYLFPVLHKDGSGGYLRIDLESHLLLFPSHSGDHYHNERSLRDRRLLTTSWDDFNFAAWDERVHSTGIAALLCGSTIIPSQHHSSSPILKYTLHLAYISWTITARVYHVGRCGWKSERDPEEW